GRWSSPCSANLVKVARRPRWGPTPQPQQPVRIRASKRARITPLKGFKDAVVKTSLAPKLERGVWPPAPAAARKATATKTTAAKKTTTARKTTASKAPARKTAAKKTTPTRPAAKAPAAKKAAAKEATATP